MTTAIRNKEYFESYLSEYLTDDERAIVRGKAYAITTEEARRDAILTIDGLIVDFQVKYHIYRFRVLVIDFEKEELKVEFINK